MQPYPPHHARPPQPGAYPQPPPYAGTGRQPPYGDTYRPAPPPGFGRDRREPRQRSGVGSAVLYALLGLVAMAAGAVAFAFFALPANFVRDRAIAAVKERTGRDLVIAGPTSFQLYPALGVSLADVSLSGAPGFDGGKPLVSMKALDVSVAFWPLLKREVHVSALAMREPVFELEVDTKGNRSWDFAAADERRSRTRLAQAEPEGAAVTDASPASSNRSTGHLSNMRLDDVRIENGTLRYTDQRIGNTSEFSAINVKLALPSLAEPLDADGSLVWKGRSVNFEGALTTPEDVIEKRPAQLNLKLGAGVLDADFDGKAMIETLTTEGILSAKSSSARDLLSWLGVDVPPSSGFGAMTAKGLWRAVPESYSFNTAEIALDDTMAHGDISVDTRGVRPLVSANLKFTELDLNTYASNGEASPAKSVKPDASSGKPDTPGKADSINDLLNEAEPGPRVKGYTKRDGWSEEPFDLKVLGAIDANAKLSIGKLTVGTMHLDQSDVTVALKDRIVTTTLDQVSLYEGTGRGTITVDGTAETKMVLNAELILDDISAQPLLTDAAEIDRVAGKGRLALTLYGQGPHERAIVEALNGRVEFAFADGAIIGVNIPEMMRNLSKGNLSGLNAAPTDKTDFSEMTSTWNVKSGVAVNQDLKLVSPLLRVSGQGSVDLPAREIDYMLRPKVVASLAGQGGAQDLSGIEVPVRVHGPLANPKYTPDMAAALKDPKTVEAVKEIGKQFKGKSADEIVDGLFGDDKEGAEKAKAKGKKLLDKFLNR